MKFSIPMISRILVTLSLTLIFSTPSFSEPPNLSIVRQEIKNYYDSGNYQKELRHSIKTAHKFIINQALLNKQNKNNHKLALVLDIDETSLSNYSKMVKRDFIANPIQIHNEIIKADSPVIKPMLALYQDALKHGIKVFFVSGRTESERNATIKNLHRAGYTHWSGLYLKPQNYSNPSNIPLKSKARADITKQGYTIIATIGDQFSDIKGGYAKRGFKLPNPFYYLP